MPQEKRNRIENEDIFPEDLDVSSQSSSSINLEELHEFVIHQLIVSYNLYKIVKEFYSQQESYNKSLNLIQSLAKLPEEMNKSFSNLSKQCNKISNMQWIIISLQSLIILFLFFLLFMK